MRIGLLQEGDINRSKSFSDRYQEMIREAVAAEEAGFSCWGTSEQHFSAPRFSVSAPEVIYGAVAQHTERIKIRNMAAILAGYNHPILVAERTATVDALSDGRAELATARSNNRGTLDAFGVPLESTREHWNESLEIIARAFQEDPFEYEGEFWTIPPRSLVPKPVQTPHPPLYLIATGVDTPAIAAQKGIGMISWDNYMGWDFLEAHTKLYRENIGSAGPVGANVNDYIGFYVATAYCAETRAEAEKVAGELTRDYVMAAAGLYRQMPSSLPNYAYMQEMAGQLDEHAEDIDYLHNHTPTILVGTPDEFITKLRRMEDLGVEEVLLRIDGFGHEENLRSIELLGESVVPEVAREPTPAAAD